LQQSFFAVVPTIAVDISLESHFFRPLFNRPITVNAREVSGNIAYNDGGGIWIDYDNLNKLFVATIADVTFSDNSAATMYDIAETDKSLHDALIKCTVWSNHLIYGYNNYDISYTKGTQLQIKSVTITNSHAETTGAGTYLSGTTVTIDAGAIHGYIFCGWEVISGDVTLTDIESNITTFIMPTEDVAIMANWAEILPQEPWSLIKLILCSIGMLIALFALIMVFVQKNSSLKWIWPLLAIIAVAAGVVILFCV